MARARRKDANQEVPHIVEPMDLEPNCPRCKEQEFRSMAKTIDNNSGSFIYCASCGCIVGWTPKPK